METIKEMLSRGSTRFLRSKTRRQMVLNMANLEILVVVMGPNLAEIGHRELKHKSQKPQNIAFKLLMYVVDQSLS